MTPKDHDGPTAISHPYWVQTLTALMGHPSSNKTTKQLAEICLNLVEICRNDPEAIEFLNARASRIMESEDEC